MISPANDSYYLAKAQIRAFSQDGACLSTECTGANDILNWSCKYGHQWQEQLGKVLRGNWCPACQLNHATTSPTKNRGL